MEKEGPLNKLNPIAQEADLVCEALVRELHRFPRWTHVVAVGTAIAFVRQQQHALEAEADHLRGEAPKEERGE